MASLGGNRLRCSGASARFWRSGNTACQPCGLKHRTTSELNPARSTPTALPATAGANNAEASKPAWGVSRISRFRPWFLPRGFTASRPMSSVPTPSRWQWVYALALAATVVWASSHGQVAIPDCADFANFDKLAHASIFGLMATLVLRPFRTRHLVWAIVIASLFGVSDELHQHFTPGRSMDVLDWVADTTGAVVAVGFYTRWAGYRRLLETPLLKIKPRVETIPFSTQTEAAS